MGLLFIIIAMDTKNTKLEITENKENGYGIGMKEDGKKPNTIKANNMENIESTINIRL